MKLPHRCLLDGHDVSAQTQLHEDFSKHTMK